MDPTRQGNCKFNRWFWWVIFLALVLEETVRGKQGALLDGLGLCGTVERTWGVAHTSEKLALTSSRHFGCL